MACTGARLALHRAGAVLGSALLAAGCAATNAPGEVTLTEVTLTEVEAGVHSAVHERAYLVIERADDFALWYRGLHAHRLPVPPAPGVDFGRRLALAVSMGRRASGGYDVRLSDPVLDGDTVKVTVLEGRPAPATAQITLVTSPYAIATVARGEYDKVAFVEPGGQVLAVRKVAAPRAE